MTPLEHSQWRGPDKSAHPLDRMTSISLAARVLAILAVGLVWHACPSSVEAQIGVRIGMDRTVELQNLGDEPFIFSRYVIRTATDSLDPDGWRPIAAQAIEDPTDVIDQLGFEALTFGVEVSESRELVEATLGGRAILPPGGFFSIGSPFDPNLPFDELKNVVDSQTTQMLLFIPDVAEPDPSAGIWKPIDGDVDLDDDVDLEDFSTLKDNFGTVNAIHEQGDLDDDGLVQLSDFVIVKDNFGNTVESLLQKQLQRGAFAVPEPTSWILMAFATAAFLAVQVWSQRGPRI